MLFFRKEMLIVYFIYLNIHEQFLTTFYAVIIIVNKHLFKYFSHSAKIDLKYG